MAGRSLSTVFVVFLFGLLFGLFFEVIGIGGTAPALAESFDDIKNRYPSTHYIVGVGEVTSSGNDYRDRRLSSIMARLEIAKQIKVRISETTLDYMCEGQGKSIFKEGVECKNQFIMIVEESVDEMLEGTRVVEEGKDEGRGVYYAVAVLPRKEIIEKATEGYNDSLGRAKEYIEKAKESKDGAEKKENADMAREELKRSMAYEGERSAFTETKEHSKDLFNDLAGELNSIDDEW